MSTATASPRSFICRSASSAWAPDSARHDPVGLAVAPAQIPGDGPGDAGVVVDGQQCGASRLPIGLIAGHGHASEPTSNADLRRGQDISRISGKKLPRFADAPVFLIDSRKAGKTDMCR